MDASNLDKEAAKTEKCLPLFRWAGGKRRLLSQIVPLLPEKYNRYYEPFCGGAALFFELRPSHATIGDKNNEIINCYRQVKLQPDQVIFALQRLEKTKRAYYEVRKNELTDPIQRAARFIYLMALSFNGLYRVSSSGRFNVPYGGKNKNLPTSETIRNVSKTLADVELCNGDFAATVKDAGEGDLVYFDPPYTVAHENNGFVQYNEKIFSWLDQVRLVEVAEDLTNRGCHVVISNAAHASIQTIYLNFKTHVVTRHSAIGGLPKARKHIAEFVFTK